VRVAKAQTMAFASVAVFQIFNSLNCRSRTKSVFTLGLTTNRYLILAVGLAITLQFLAINTALFNSLLRTVPIGLIDWAEVILVSLTIFFAEELRKFIAGRRLLNH